MITRTYIIYVPIELWNFFGANIKAFGTEPANLTTGNFLGSGVITPMYRCIIDLGDEEVSILKLTYQNDIKIYRLEDTIQFRTAEI